MSSSASLSFSAPLASPTPVHPCYAIMEGVTRVEQKCLAEAESKAMSGLAQDGVNIILLERAQCECKRAYSGTRPDVQLAVGGCAGKFGTSEEEGIFSRRVTRCLDGDFGGLALEKGFAVVIDGASVAYSDPSYQKPAYDEPPRTFRSTSSARRHTCFSIRSLVPYFVVFFLCSAV